MKTFLDYNWACLAKVTDGETIIHAFGKGIYWIAQLSWESLCKLELLNRVSFGKLLSYCHHLRDCYETDVSSLCMSWLVRFPMLKFLRWRIYWGRRGSDSDGRSLSTQKYRFESHPLPDIWLICWNLSMEGKSVLTIFNCEYTRHNPLLNHNGGYKIPHQACFLQLSMKKINSREVNYFKSQWRL